MSPFDGLYFVFAQAQNLQLRKFNEPDVIENWRVMVWVFLWRKVPAQRMLIFHSLMVRHKSFIRELCHFFPSRMNKRILSHVWDWTILLNSSGYISVWFQFLIFWQSKILNFIITISPFSFLFISVQFKSMLKIFSKIILSFLHQPWLTVKLSYLARKVLTNGSLLILLLLETTVL